MWDLLLHSFSNKGIELNTEEIEIVQSLFRPKTYRKHQYIVQQGEIVRYESFIVNGLARKYEVDDRGQEHILLFMQDAWWAGDLYSFYTGNPSPYHVDCMEETAVLQITKADLDKLYVQVPKMNIYFRILYQNAIISYNQRVSSNLGKTALERYYEFLARYPQLEQKIPNHQIASFLGITPQSLSRIRGQAAVKKG